MYNNKQQFRWYNARCVGIVWISKNELILNNRKSWLSRKRKLKNENKMEFISYPTESMNYLKRLQIAEARQYVTLYNTLQVFINKRVKQYDKQ